ncbi:hypothetical protein DM48_7834 [Burkholderia gladioli]|uniref:Uncharacterized protein n=1 Tax=Burkholderia gladioli TaxID=28095 RepID=A0AAW3FC64_BURGA|nr:hypothetical protein DM48_7834 [Burkholderia gladioli]
MRADVGLLAQIRSGGVAGRHELVWILVAQLVERERAAPRDADRLIQRAGRIEVGQAQPGSQVPLCIRRELVAAFAHRPAQPDRRQHVLQGLPRAHVHHRPARGYHRHVVSSCCSLNSAAVNVIHGARMQGQRDPRAIAEHGREPLDLGVEPLLVGGKVRREDRHAVGQASEMRERCLGVLEIQRCEPIGALRAARAGKRDQLTEVAVALAVHCERRECQRRRAVGRRQPKVRADDERQACGLGLDVRAHNAGERALVRDRDRAVAEPRRALDQFLGA